MPQDARTFRLVKICCTLKWLHGGPPPSRERDAAYDAVALFEAEPDLKAGLRHRETQQARAKCPRDTVTADGITMREIISKLVRRHPDEQAREIWPHFISVLSEADLDPEEKTGANNRDRSVQYRNRHDAGKPRTLTLCSFSALLRKARKEASRKLPA